MPMPKWWKSRTSQQSICSPYAYCTIHTLTANQKQTTLVQSLLLSTFVSKVNERREEKLTSGFFFESGALLRTRFECSVHISIQTCIFIRSDSPKLPLSTLLKTLLLNPKQDSTAEHERRGDIFTFALGHGGVYHTPRATFSLHSYLKEVAKKTA